MHDAIYLDWNATTPPADEALDAMHAAARHAWGNPSSTHGHGARARREVESAREAVAALLGADPRDVTLCSGGTEANNLALRSWAHGAGGKTLVTSRLEHPSVTRVAEALQREGKCTLHWLAVGRDGRIELDDLRAVLRAGGVGLVAVQAVNQETGVHQPLDAVLTETREHGVHVHVDVVQALGRTGETWLEADTRAVAAHKLRGPKGLGALVSRPGLKLWPQMMGGAQEKGLRGGTLDPAAAAGFAAAATRARHTSGRYGELAPLRDALEQAVLALWPGALVAGAEAERAPHVTNVVLPGVLTPELVAALSLEGLSVSAGSACSAGTVDPSPVLEAMLGAELARSGLRMSLGETTTGEEIDRAIVILQRVLPRFR